MRGSHASRPLALFLAGAALLALGVVWYTQHVLQIMPCELCLWERWPWRLLLGTAIVASVLPDKVTRQLLWLTVPFMVADIGLSICHVGVEWQWWPSPLPACHAPHISGHTMAERLASMPLLPSKPCDAATYLVPGVPVSMAAMGGLYAAAVLWIFMVWRKKLERVTRRIFH